MRELLEKAGGVGLLGHDVPEQYGGLGGDKTSSSLITEAASRQGSFAVSFGAHVGIGTMPIVLFGTPEQRQKYLPKLATGELIAAYALTEPGSGSDALAAKTKAVKSADGNIVEADRVEAVHHQRGLRRSVHRVREGRRRAVHRVPRRARRARPHHRPRGAQARHPRQLDLPAVPRGLHHPDRYRAGGDRPGAQDRVQHPQHRPLEAGRRVGGRREVLPGAGREVRARSASSSASRSRSSISSARRSATSPRRRSSPNRWPSAPPACSTRGRRRSIRRIRRCRRSRWTRSRSTRSRRRSSRCSARRCCTRRRTRRCRSSAAPATSRTTRSSASAATRASTASSRGRTRSTACWCRARCSSAR